MEDLVTYFSTFEYVNSCVIARDNKKDTPQGYAFLSYARMEDTLEVLNTTTSHVIRGVIIDAKRLLTKGDKTIMANNDTLGSSRKVFVIGFPQLTDPKELENFLSAFRRVEQVEMRVKKSDASSAYAFVLLEDATIASQMLEAKCFTFGKHKLTISRALTRVEMQIFKKTQAKGDEPLKILYCTDKKTYITVNSRAI